MMLLTRVYDALLTIAYPQVCRVCGGSVERRSLGVACEQCWKATRIFTGTETMCWKCGELSPATGVEIAADLKHEITCRRCDSQAFTAARTVGFYEKALRESVLALKRKPHVSDVAVELLVAAAQREPLNQATRIVPVPLHDKRLKERGFNQAAVIAEALAKHLELPVDETSVVRIRGSEKYRAGLDPKGRRDTVTGAFRVRYPRLVADESVLLVDDVFTTGATVNSCAEALIKAKARRVLVLTVARGKS